MKISTIVIIVLALIVLSGGIFFLNSQRSPSNTVMQNDQGGPSSISEQEELQSNGRYKTYNATILEETKGKKRVLFFYANWCPTCLPADANFQASADRTSDADANLQTNANKIPDDVVVIRVNYNDTDTDEEEKELARKYGITYQHTFVQIDGDGNVVKKWNGGQIEELLTNLQ